MTAQLKPIDFEVFPLVRSSVIHSYLDRNKVYLEPAYQREGNIWSLEKQQLLIDSLINRFDVPKMYFHELPKGGSEASAQHRYAVVDGKQRLMAIWNFISNGFPLSDDFVYMKDPTLALAGKTYSELGKEFSLIKADFEATPLTIMVVRTDEIELIEEMFSRLNEAVALSAAEKRNALGGPIPKLIRSLAKHPFFTSRLPFSNRRYRHYDVACKFLLLNYRETIVDVKKISLDEFVRDFKSLQDAEKHADALGKRVRKLLDSMASVFTANDPLLKSVGILTALYTVFLAAAQEDLLPEITRVRFADFQRLRESNATLAAKDIRKADYSLLRFEELASTVNDEYAIRFKGVTICRKVLGDKRRLIKWFQRQPAEE